MNSKQLLHKLFSLLEAKPLVGGLDISDSSMRFMASASNFVSGVRLPPGIVVDGRIQDENAFVEALAQLRTSIIGKRALSRARINVVVTLSSMRIYSQLFSLPAIEGDELEKAVDLNLKMASPTGTESYAGWEVLEGRREADKLEILSAFLEKSIADDVVRALGRANFSVIAIEPRGVSLGRVLTAAPGIDWRSPFIVVSADPSGLDVVVVRNGKMQFEYYNSWQDLQGTEKEMSLEAFRALLTRSVNQVLNFYTSRWKDPVTDILVAATGMKEEILAALTSNFSIKVREIASPVSPPVTPDWYSALGGALRGRMPRRQDSEISLLGIDAQENFHREQVDHFLSFWRVLAPTALSLLLIVFIGTGLFLNSVENSLENQAALKLSPAQLSEINTLKSEAEEFNRKVLIIATINSNMAPKSPLLSKLSEITNRRGIVVSRLTLGAPGVPVSLVGMAESEEDIRSFKNELSITPGIRDVNLPITDIKKEGESYTFSMTFAPSS